MITNENRIEVLEEIERLETDIRCCTPDLTAKLQSRRERLQDEMIVFLRKEADNGLSVLEEEFLNREDPGWDDD